MKARLPSILREMFFGALALGILYDQVFIAATAQPILIFLAIFFLGSIPALRGDKKDQVGPFARFIMALMGIDVKELAPPKEMVPNTPGDKDSSPDTPTSPDSQSPAPQEPSGPSSFTSSEDN